ncbi:MAG: type II toxin-antitoxin system RelE/ParE family toxin [Parcubacteria group bacterium]|nr:type II toxin-antitoxin system RelE/ParE family toxin [Parcubacteria group bacterium]
MYQTVIVPHFRRQLERYVKKYRHLARAVIHILDSFDARQHARLGGNVYKVRIKTKDLPRGKSSGFRLIVLVVEVHKYLVPATLYFKGDKDTLSQKEINDHLSAVYFELEMQKLLSSKTTNKPLSSNG